MTSKKKHLRTTKCLLYYLKAVTAGIMSRIQNRLPGSFKISAALGSIARTSVLNNLEGPNI
jgi:hypothetical protein